MVAEVTGWSGRTLGEGLGVVPVRWEIRKIGDRCLGGHPLMDKVEVSFFLCLGHLDRVELRPKNTVVPCLADSCSQRLRLADKVSEF